MIPIDNPQELTPSTVEALGYGDVSYQSLPTDGGTRTSVVGIDERQCCALIDLGLAVGTGVGDGGYPQTVIIDTRYPDRIRETLAWVKAQCM